MAKTPERYNDGLLQYGTIQTVRENGKRVGENFIPALFLYYNEMNVRQSDLELAEASNQLIDLKLKTQYVHGVSKDSHKVIIENETYDIYLIDKDIDDKYLYWYLAKEGRNGN